MTSTINRRGFLHAAGLGLGGLALSGCGGGFGASSGTDAKGRTVITVALASTPQFDDLVTLTSHFEKTHPDVIVKYLTLPENQLRSQLVLGAATSSSPFDVVAVGPYEVGIWSPNGWLEDLSPYMSKDSAYDVGDFIPAAQQGVTFQNRMYAAPFDAESSCLMYRQDLFSKRGLSMPAEPTWQQVHDLAAQLHDPKNGVAGIAMRGAPGWGDGLGTFNNVSNCFGAIWYDQQWKPQLTSEPWRQAAKFWIDLQSKYGIPGVASAGFPETLTAFAQGNAAMWYDATSACPDVQDPAGSKVAGKVGYVVPPTGEHGSTDWLWSWNLAMTPGSKNKEAAWAFIRWATSKDYLHLVGTSLGWGRVPPGHRKSLYEIPQYRKVAVYADVTIKALDSASMTRHPSPVPYEGVFWLKLPAYQDFGTSVAQQLTSAIVGTASIEQALTNSQHIAQLVASDNAFWEKNR